MLFYSTNNHSDKTNFKEATIKGQAYDKGLYFPEFIPKLSTSFLRSFKFMSKEEIAFHVIKPYTGSCIPENELKQIIEETVNFEFPLISVEKNIFALELFHGPTLAFKDVGARFMSRCLNYFVKGADKKITVLVATSGDTGGAVANGFYNVEGIDVIILYPSGKVSNVQELQLTTLGSNVTALKVNGSFDDCQQMVKQAFADKELNQKFFLTSANSINIARWLPQQFYYFFAYINWPYKEPPVFSIPSGNFGNICAGLLAYLSGLPVHHFIAACNANDSVCSYLENGQFQSKSTIQTISNAMDVGNPSNFVRLIELFNNEFSKLKNTLSGFSITDEETIESIKYVYHSGKYLLDPHGAVGYLSLKKYLEKNPGQYGIFLETAHPIKFYDVIEPHIKREVQFPEPIKELLLKEKKFININNRYDVLKELMMQIK